VLAIFGAALALVFLGTVLPWRLFGLGRRRDDDADGGADDDGGDG
jgi:hypothetical protein